MVDIPQDHLKKLMSSAHQQYQGKLKIVSTSQIFRFSFVYLMKNLQNFNCDATPNASQTLSTILQIFKEFSFRDPSYLAASHEHSHFITEKELLKRGHQEIVAALKQYCGGNYMQLGTDDQGNRNRIFGFLDPKESNVFQVCLIDHSHRIYPRNFQKVFINQVPT